MLVRYLLLSFLGAALAEQQYYATYNGTVLSDEEYEEFVEKGVTTFCVIQVEDCDETEGRRLDGTCNNIDNPTRGAPSTPVKRLLDAVFANEAPTGYEPRKSVCGANNSLPLSRAVRTRMLSEGKLSSQNFTHLLTNFWLFMTLDCTLSQDTLNYVINRPYCCLEEGKSDYMCTPNFMPIDDPVHRFSDVKCMNMSRPVSYQNYGCIDNSSTPDRINSASPPFDLSFLYGAFLNLSLAARLNETGLLRYDEDENGRIWPPSIAESPKSVCRLNEEPAETRCHDVPIQVTNTLLGGNLVLVWLWRQHNSIARKLAELNPTWDDETLFYTARDINIAIAVQILYYEMYPLMMGRERMIKDGIISEDDGFRDLYEADNPPHMTHEYLYALRWVHTIQEGAQKMYDTSGNYLKQIPVSNLTFRTGYLGVDNNMEYITQGNFRQACADHDYVVDPDVSEQSLGALQRSLDLLVNDHAKSRYLGLQPYIKYREYCTGNNYSTWDDLAADIDYVRIEQLKEVYECVDDVELMAGIWAERPVEGGVMPATVYCLTSQQLITNVKTDRHWFERDSRPNAFSAAQLAEIRKASIARFMCDNGDSVSEIQPRAFERAGSGNEIVSCDQIPAVNFTAWQES